MTVVNLNEFRKSRDLTAKKAEADLNARKFGRTKAERLAEAAKEARARVHLDGHKFEGE